jgi:hypothetical protein
VEVLCLKKSGDTRLVEDKEELPIYLIPIYSLKLTRYSEEARAREKHDKCGECCTMIPVSEIVAHVAAHRR